MEAVTNDEQFVAGMARAVALVRDAVVRARQQGWISGAGEDAEEVSRPHDAATSLDVLRERLGLTATEVDVLWVLVGFELDPRVRALLSRLSGDVPAVTHGALLSTVYSVAARLAMSELGDAGPLVRSQLVLGRSDDAETAWSARRLRASKRVIELALGVQGLDAELDEIAKLETTSATVLGELELPDGARSRVRAALEAADRSGTVLIGRSGSGRRSLLAAAVAASGKRALAVECSHLADDDITFRSQLRVIVRECRLFDLVPLFRGLELLSERTAQLSIFESELEGLRYLATASRRVSRSWNRAPLLVELGDLSAHGRASLWRRELALTNEDNARMLASVYPVAPAVIVKASALALRSKGEEELEPRHVEIGIRTILDDQLAGLAHRVLVSQTWDDLVLPGEQRTAIIEMLARVRERSRVLEDWGFAQKVGKGVGITALFSGPPGTGKTMAAGLIAKALSIEVFQVDLSKIVSKWIGETEKNLARLFDAAEACHAMLLFDEADALFGKRTEVRSSNDRHANQEVNFLLQRMEHYAGICVLTTNHETAIDEAFRRRLSLHVRFPMPEVAERARLWAAMIPRAAPVSPDLPFATLAERYSMSGGYIRNAVLRAAYLAADEEAPISGGHLARAAQMEYEAMGRVLPR